MVHTSIDQTTERGEEGNGGRLAVSHDPFEAIGTRKLGSLRRKALSSTYGRHFVSQGLEQWEATLASIRWGRSRVLKQQIASQESCQAVTRTLGYDGNGILQMNLGRIGDRLGAPSGVETHERSTRSWFEVHMITRPADELMGS